MTGCVLSAAENRARLTGLLRRLNEHLGSYEPALTDEGLRALVAAVHKTLRDLEEIDRTGKGT